MARGRRGAVAAGVVSDREVPIYDLDSGIDPRQAARRGPRPSPVSGWRRRVAAFAVDGAFLAVLGSGLGMVWGETFSTYGGYARLIGAALAVAYFGVLNSAWGGGRTLGKRLFRIRVVTRKGEPLPFARSLVRVTVLLLAFGWGAAPLLSDPLADRPGLLATLAFRVLGSAALCLMIFNRRPGQSLHDLIAGSWVVNAKPFEVGALPATGRGPRVAAAVCAALALCLTLIGSDAFNRQPTHRQLNALHHEIARSLPVRQVTVRKRIERRQGPRKTARPIHRVDVSMVLTIPSLTFEEAAHEAARSVLLSPPDGRVDVLSVTVASGYDILIARSWKRHTYTFPSSEWRRRLSNFDNPHRPVTTR